MSLGIEHLPKSGTPACEVSPYRTIGNAKEFRYLTPVEIGPVGQQDDRTLLDAECFDCLANLGQELGELPDGSSRRRELSVATLRRTATPRLRLVQHRPV